MLGNKEDLLATASIAPTKARPRSQIESVLCLLTGLNQQRQRPLIRKLRLVHQRNANSLKGAETLSGAGGGPCEPGQGRTDLLSDASATSTEEALRNFSYQLINVQETERQRIATELQGDLSQRMAILSIELQQLDQAIPKQKRVLRTCVQDLWAKAQEISAEINRLSYQLHPPKLEHLGLVAAVTDFCADVSERHALSIEFRHQGFPAAIPKDVALCVFRVVQESLHNVIRHSGAHKALVVLTKNDHAIHLRVSDEGCGFDVASAGSKGRLGLLSMCERLRLVGGDISVRSQPSRGTEISAFVPLARPS